MQFSDSPSTDSSASSTPRYRMEAVMGRGLPPAGGPTSATPAQLNSTVRAFQATTSSERRGSNDAAASALRIQLTAGLGGTANSAVPTQATTRGVAPTSVLRGPMHGDSSESDSDSDEAPAAATAAVVRHVPLSLQSPPPFFAKVAAPAAAAGSAHVKAFRIVSSSSSASSVNSASSDDAPAIQRSAVTKTAAALTAAALAKVPVTQRLQLHHRTDSTTSSAASSSSASDSSSVANQLRRSAGAARRSSASSSGSSASEVVLQRMALPSTPQPGHTTVATAHHQDPHMTRAAVVVPVSASTLTDTGRSDVTSEDAGIGGASLPTSHASPLPLRDGGRPTQLFPTATAAAAAAAGRASTTPEVRSPLSASPATVSFGSSMRDATPLPLMRPAAVTAVSAAAAQRRRVDMSSFEDCTGDDDDDELDSSAASQAAQAALDAEEQRALERPSSVPVSMSSPALSAMAAQSFSAAPSLTPIPAYETASSAGTSPPPQRGHVTASGGFAHGDVGARRVTRTMSPTHLGSGRQLLSPVEPAGLEEMGEDEDDDDDALLVPLQSNAVHDTTSPPRDAAASAPRRQPPPPPTPSTATKKSPADSSALQPDAESEAHEDDHSTKSSSTASECFPVRERTSERLVAPPTATRGTTTTQATSTEAAQAVVHYSASLLPPTRSSSSSSSSDGGKNYGAARPGAPSPKGARQLLADHSDDSEDHHNQGNDDDDDTEAMSVPHLHGPPPAPPSAGAVLLRGTSEEGVDAAEENIGSTTLPSTVSAHMAPVLVKPPPAVVRERPTASAVVAETTSPEPHGETATAVLPTTQATPRHSFSTPSGSMLMAPSPSQPRASGPPLLKATPPDATTSASSSSSSAATEVAARVPAAAVASRFAEAEETSDDSLSAMVAQPAAAEVPRRMVMRRLSDSPASSSSSSSAPPPREARMMRPSTQRSADGVSGAGAVQQQQQQQHQLRRAPSDSGEGSHRVMIAAAPADLVSPVDDHWPARDGGDEADGADEEEAAAAGDDKDNGNDDDASSGVNWEDQADDDGAQTDNPRAIQEAGRWDKVLEPMELIDVTVVSRLYQQSMPRGTSHDDAEVESELDEANEVCLFKVLSLFPIAGCDARARWSLRPRVQRQLLALAEEMRMTQAALDDAGLTAAGVERAAAQLSSSPSMASRLHNAADPHAHRRTRTTCAGVTEVYVDASCRLIAQLDAEPCMVSLRHLVAASSGTGLRDNELLALLRTVVCKTATMHASGFAHGALHAGNVLLSSYDGDAVLTQPCGLMSQSTWLPSDLSVISVARARAIMQFLPSVWGARQLHIGSETSTRLGAPQRPDTAELVAYHNLAALAWDAETRGAGADAYIATEADDLHALGMVAFFLYTGIPPFQMTSLWAAVERLVALGDAYEAALHASSAASSPAVARQAARRVVAEFCFGTERQPRRSNSGGGETGGAKGATAKPALPDLFTCAYGVTQRHTVARFRPELEEALQTFIVDCVEAACLATATSPTSTAPPHGYSSAVDLLERHAIFRLFAVPHLAGEEGEEEEEADSPESESAQGVDERMRDMVHRVAYPAFCTWTAAREGCGSAPHLSRLHANALFTARCTAMCESVLRASSAVARDRYDDDDDDAVPLQAVLCPQVAGTLRTWRVPFPSIDAPQCCNRDGGSSDMQGSKEQEQTSHRGSAAASTAADRHAKAHASWSSAADVRALSDVPALRELSALLRPSPAAAPSWLEAAHERQRSGSAEEGAGPLAHTGDAASAPLSALAATTDEAALVAQLVASAGPRRGDTAAAAEGEFLFRAHLHALVLAEKREAAFSLSRAVVLAHVAPAADTLVLQHLTDCTVTILAPFRYVVMDGLQRCEVRLGPCATCVLRDVHECALIAVAAMQLSGNNVTGTHLSWSGQDGGRPRLERCHSITTSLYGLAYEGLGQDYARVGLVSEHSASLAVTGDTGAAPHHRNRRTVALCATSATSASRTQSDVELPLAPEAPYAHALLACSTRYVHTGFRSGETRPWPSDVFHFYGELGEKDVTVCDVHGSSRDATARPIIVLLGNLGDVAVERCSFCTIVIAGTPGNLQASSCSDCQLIFMARESVMESCMRVDCVALVTEYLLLRDCDSVRLRPLFLDCPFSDEILRRVVAGSVGGAEEATVVGAYEAGRMDELNAVLRGVGHGVHVEESTDVVVEDVGFYYERRRGGDADHHHKNSAGGGGDGEEGEDGDGMSVVLIEYASMPGPGVPGGVSETSQFVVEAAQALAEHLSVPCYVEPLQRYGGYPSISEAAAGNGQRPTVCFHDLIDCSVLRLQGALCPLESSRLAAPSSASPSPTTAETLVDLFLERLHGGVLYVEDAVHTLRLRRCTGPLDVVVCAATTVLMEGCVGVQLRVACVDYRATDCANCHVALHVTNPPQYQRCTGVQTSTLNITARDMEAMLSAAGVDLAGNAYAAPMLLTEDWATTAAAGQPDPSLQPAALHALCAGSVEAVTSPHSTADLCAAILASVHREQLHPRFARNDGGGSATPRVPPDEVPLVMALLRQPVTVVAPLPGLCVGADAAPFLEELETRVAVWSRRPLSVSREEAMGVALYALADIAEAYAYVAEWRSSAAEDVAEVPDALPSSARASSAAASSDHLVTLDEEEEAEAEGGGDDKGAGEDSVEQVEKEDAAAEADSCAALEREGVHMDDVDSSSSSSHNADAVPAMAAPPPDYASETGSAEAKEEKEETGEEEEEEREESVMHVAEENFSEGPALSPMPTALQVTHQHADPMRYASDAEESAQEGDDVHAEAVEASAGEETAVVHSDMSMMTSIDGVLSDLPTHRGTSPLPTRLAGIADMAQHARATTAATGSLFLTSESVEDRQGPHSRMGSSSAVSRETPPLPPGPAHALAPLDVDASSAMDVFSRRQRDAESRMREGSPRPEPTQSPEVAAGSAAGGGAAGTLHRGVALASPLRIDDGSCASGLVSAPDAVASSSAAATAAAAAAGAWPPASSRGSPQCRQLHTVADDNESSSDRPLMATTVHLRAVAVEGDAATPPEEEAAAESVVVSHPHRDLEPPTPAVMPSSSSSSEYPRRGASAPSCDSSANRGASGGPPGAGATPGAPHPKTTPPVTTYLNLSQASTPRLARSSSTAPTATATATTTHTADAASHNSAPVHGQSATSEPAVAHSDGVGIDRVFDTASWVPANAASLHELLQRVEQARQAFVQRQRQLQISPGGGGLEARVRAAVAKLSAQPRSSDTAAAA